MLVRRFWALVILGVLAAACTPTAAEPTVRSVYSSNRQATEAAVIEQREVASTVLQNSRGYSTGVYALMNDTLYIFDAEGNVTSTTPDVLNVWQSGTLLFEQRSDGLYLSTNGIEPRFVIALEPMQTVRTLLVSPDAEWVLIGYQTELGLAIELPFRVEDWGLPYQDYSVINLNNGAHFPVTIAGEDVDGYVFFQAIPSWTTDNRLVMFGRLLPQDYELDFSGGRFFGTAIHEVFEVDPIQQSTRWVEEVVFSFNSFDNIAQFRDNAFARLGPNPYLGFELAPLPGDITFGTSVIERDEDTFVSSISINYGNYDGSLCSLLTILREPIQGVFLPIDVYRDESASISPLWLHNGEVWFLRGVAPDCDERQINRVLMAATLEGEVRTVLNMTNTHADPYNLVFVPAPDGRALLWGSGDANNVLLMATYPDSDTTEVIFRQPRMDGRGLVAAGWLSTAPD